ncbi:MAG TPA: 6-phosphogluconolactonase [Terriglobales bacterium]|nr:6-phosphogluconolactonase [Terriglobales bacterium]
MPSSEEIHVLPTAQELFEAAAREFVTQSAAAIAARGKFSVALSGGSTPKGLYALLAERPAIAWNKIYFFFGDERNVPPDDAESNYRMASEAMLTRVPVPRENIFRVPTEVDDAEAAALRYQDTLRKFFALRDGEFPRFDLILLGMGSDGHIASLIPGTAALDEKVRLVVANWAPKLNSYRITFTFPVLNHAACAMFLASGPDKAPMIHQVLEEQRADLPAARVHPLDGRLIWMLDQAAAVGLSEATRA